MKVFLSKSPASKIKILTATLLIATLAGNLLVDLAAASFMPPDAPSPIITYQLPEDKAYSERAW